MLAVSLPSAFLHHRPSPRSSRGGHASESSWMRFSISQFQERSQPASMQLVRRSEVIEAACQEFPPALAIEKVALARFVRYPANFMNGNALDAFGNFAFQLGRNREEQLIVLSAIQRVIPRRPR